ncbi:MAG: HAD-IC family P-type ATPase, partial [Anaerolineae bacterium]|nr:HAD-IC family P-type ATPase [Anaerolineae bacterium]
YIAFTKGAVDSLLDVAAYVWEGEMNNINPLDDQVRERILAANSRFAERGQRVLGVAIRPLEETEIDALDDIEEEMIFIGLVAMIDPPRPEVKTAVATARKAGIRPVMITGDHPLTALYIAKDLDITDSEQYLTGQDLSSISLPELEDVVEDVAVYARVSPEHKLNIVNALQDKGEIVAMTGDGVNDAPALKKAEIGV